MAELGRTYTKGKIDTLLANKASTSHTHSLDNLSDVDTTTTPADVADVLTWDGTNWVPNPSGGGGGGTAGVGSVDGVTPALAGGNIDLVASSSRITITPNDGTDSIAYDVAQASDTQQGAVELATNAESLTGSDTARATTPANVKHVLDNRVATDTATGLVELATNAETQAGSDTTRAIHPAGLASLTASSTRAGLTEHATAAEIQAGAAGNLVVTAAEAKAEHDRRSKVAYYFDAQRISSTQDLGSSGDSTKVIFNQQNTDNGNWYNQSSGLATIPVTGLYRLYASMRWSTPSSPETGSLGYAINGTGTVYMVVERFAGVAEVTSSFAIELVFTAGQTVEIRAETSTGSINADASAATRFQMRFLGELL